MVDLLDAEAERYLAAIFEQFSHRVRNVKFPLTEVTPCRAFAETVTEAMGALWHSQSRLPPAALILAMIRVCEKLSDHSSATMSLSADFLGVPRPFAHEMLERLRCELPPTKDFALNQVSRIVDESGSLTQEHAIRYAFQVYRLRHEGAMWAAELDEMVTAIWAHRYSEYAHLMHQRRAA